MSWSFYNLFFPSSNNNGTSNGLTKSLLDAKDVANIADYDIGVLFSKKEALEREVRHLTESVATGRIKRLHLEISLLEKHQKEHASKKPNPKDIKGTEKHEKDAAAFTPILNKARLELQKELAKLQAEVNKKQKEIQEVQSLITQQQALPFKPRPVEKTVTAPSSSWFGSGSDDSGSGLNNPPEPRYDAISCRS